MEAVDVSPTKVISGCHTNVEDIILTFNADSDLLNNIWYTPRVMVNYAIMSLPLDYNPRTSELAILSLSHISGLTN